MKRLALLIVLLAGPAFAEPPFVKLPAEVAATSGTFIVVTAESNGKTIRWVPLDAGLSMIPTDLLRDTKTAICMAAKGRYRLLAYTALADESSVPSIVTIIVDAAPVPPPDKPPDPPPDKPPPVTGSLYFVLVRPDGPAHPTFTRIVSDPAWQEIIAKGHQVKDFTLAEARALGVAVPEKTDLPCVVTLRLSADRKKSSIARAAMFLPPTLTGAEILTLLEGL